MGSPYTATSVSNYNANPPSDDGAQTASNRVQWATQKTKLADPVYNAFNSSETATVAAFGKVVGGAGITTTAISYAVTASDQSKIIKATASGITITTPDATVVGAPFVFSVVNDSSADISFTGASAQTIDGSTTVTIPAGCGMMVNTDGSNWFSDGQNFNNVQQSPQGRLTLVSGTPVMNTDETAKTSVFYTPYVGNKVPISTNGTSFKVRSFSELTLTLVANHLASTIYDVFLFDNSGTITIGTGPAWNNNTAGSCARGTGAGTTQLSMVNGLLTNTVSMTARNGATTYTVAANEGTYVGTIFIDAAAGQVSCHFSYGQSRKFGIWNAYQRRRIALKAGDSTANWNSAGTLGPINAASANVATSLCGLAEEMIDARYVQSFTAVMNNNTVQYNNAIGYNSISASSGKKGLFENIASAPATLNQTIAVDTTAEYIAAPSLGINNFQMLEATPNGGSGHTSTGTEASCLMVVSWMG